MKCASHECEHCTPGISEIGLTKTASMLSNRSKRKMSVVWLIMITCLSGCGFPYPIYKTLQPASQLTVLDRHLRPIEAAEVILSSRASPSFASKESRETQVTNAHGIATFKGKNEWRVETLMIHGGEIFSWSWCVQ